MVSVANENASILKFCECPFYIWDSAWARWGADAVADGTDLDKGWIRVAKGKEGG